MKKAEVEQKAILFQVCKNNTSTPQEALKHFEAITDMLAMQKAQSLLNGVARKKGRKSFQHKGFIQCLENRMEQLIQEESN